MLLRASDPPASPPRSRVLALEPVRRAAGAVRRVLALRDDGLQAHSAGVGEHGGTVRLDVLVEPQAGRRAPPAARAGGLRRRASASSPSAKSFSARRSPTERLPPFGPPRHFQDHSKNHFLTRLGGRGLESKFIVKSPPYRGVHAHGVGSCRNSATVPNNCQV